MFPLLIWLVMIGLWFLPILLMVQSKKTSSREKVAWILAMLFISWFAWIFYLLLAPLKRAD